jgi:putative heme-binding domain-containing protein
MRDTERLVLTVVSTALLLVVGSTRPAAQGHAGQYEDADISFGARLYADNCSTCHGANGDDVPGVNLRSGQFRNASSDRDLRALITRGLPDTAMPPGQYNGAELTGLIAFLRTMGDVDPGTLVLGDADRGRALFTGAGECLSCHRRGGQGSRLGPDLTDIGTARSAGALERSLTDPDGAMLPVNRPIRAVTRDGRVITGRRLNEDTFTVQMIDQDERLVSLEKADLQEFTVLTDSPMPSYGDRLSETELSDLIAYLLTLRGVD